MKNSDQFLTSLKAYAASAKKTMQALWSRFNRMTKRERRIILVAGLVLFVMFVNFAVVGPLRGNLSSLERRIREMEVMAIKNLRNTTQRSDLNALYQRLQQDIPDAHSGDEEIRATMLKDIESFARSNEVYLSDVKPQVSAEDDIMKQFSVRLQVECRMDQLMTFFADLAQSKKLYSINSFRVSPYPDDVHKIKAAVTLTRIVLLD